MFKKGDLVKRTTPAVAIPTATIGEIVDGVRTTFGCYFVKIIEGKYKGSIRPWSEKLMVPYVNNKEPDWRL